MRLFSGKPKLASFYYDFLAEKTMQKPLIFITNVFIQDQQTSSFVASTYIVRFIACNLESTFPGLMYFSLCS